MPRVGRPSLWCRKFTSASGDFGYPQSELVPSAHSGSTGLDSTYTDEVGGNSALSNFWWGKKISWPCDLWAHIMQIWHWNQPLFVSTKSDIRILWDLFQLNMSKFSTCDIIWGHHKTGTKLSQPNFYVFYFLITYYTIYSLNCVLRYMSEKYILQLKWKCVPVLCLWFLVFSQKVNFHFYLSKDLTNI